MQSHGEDLRKETNDDAWVEQIKSDYRHAKLDEKTRALLDFAVLVTNASHNVEQATIDGLRQQGWTDEDILNTVHIVGFFNYYNRMVDALGVQDEAFMPGR